MERRQFHRFFVCEAQKSAPEVVKSVECFQESHGDSSELSKLNAKWEVEDLELQSVPGDVRS